MASRTVLKKFSFSDEVEYTGPYKAIWAQNKAGEWKIIHEEYAEQARRR